jgi:hypothetical protein
VSRGYVQSWSREGPIPEKSAQTIFEVADGVLEAGNPLHYYFEYPSNALLIDGTSFSSNDFRVSPAHFVKCRFRLNSYIHLTSRPAAVAFMHFSRQNLRYISIFLADGLVRDGFPFSHIMRLSFASHFIPSERARIQFSSAGTRPLDQAQIGQRAWRSHRPSSGSSACNSRPRSDCRGWNSRDPASSIQTHLPRRHAANRARDVAGRSAHRTSAVYRQVRASRFPSPSSSTKSHGPARRVHLELNRMWSPALEPRFHLRPYLYQRRRDC